MSTAPAEPGTRNRMAAYRPEGWLTRAYYHAVNEDDCMARYLLIEAARTDSPRSTIDLETE